MPGLRRAIEFHLKCRWLKKSDAFEIISTPPGKAWLGVNNINQKRVNPRREEVHIKRHIRHAKTYRLIVSFIFDFASGEVEHMAILEAMTSLCLN